MRSTGARGGEAGHSARRMWKQGSRDVVRRRRPLSGGISLVTGAASGIGRATALALAARGGRLVLTDMQPGALAKTAGDARRVGADVLVSEPFDIRSRDAVAGLAARVHAEHESVDAVMNIAGTSVWGPVERLGHEHWRRMVDVTSWARSTSSSASCPR